jgi:hypothetical protein
VQLSVHVNEHVAVGLVPEQTSGDAQGVVALT